MVLLNSHGVLFPPFVYASMNRVIISHEYMNGYAYTPVLGRNLITAVLSSPLLSHSSSSAAFHPWTLTLWSISSRVPPTITFGAPDSLGKKYAPSAQSVWITVTHQSHFVRKIPVLRRGKIHASAWLHFTVCFGCVRVAKPNNVYYYLRCYYLSKWRYLEYSWIHLAFRVISLQ